MKIGFLSDIHEDIESLKKAITILEKAGCNDLVCLGDITGFSVPTHKYLDTRNANECISMIRMNCSIVVPGNHDLYAVHSIPKFTSDFVYPENWYSLPFDEREEIADHKIWLYENYDLSPMLNRKNQLYLKSLEEFQKADFDGIPMFFSHYAFPDMSGSSTLFLGEARQLKQHLDFCKLNKCRLSFSGHRHVEGFNIVDRDSFELFGFERHIIDDSQSLWIDGPAVCRSKKQNGVMIFDTFYKEIQSLEI